MILDSHTHNVNSAYAIISVSPTSFSPQEGHFYSVGIHPWNTAATTAEELEQLAVVAGHKQVVAIGETGLDSLRGAPLSRQEEIMRRHIDLAEQLGKPLIIHMVRTAQQLLRLKKTLKPALPWIIHGFRGNERVARQLVDAGFFISVGMRFNETAVKIIPDELLLIETDDSQTDINAIAASVAQARCITPQQLIAITNRNASGVFKV
ncbi:MAG: TatD family hydrolase [Muribaculaceae bacterium]|nr:TatD family hydrolase [Muribaculaceae bacterium]